jgi:hypothetical protein
MPTSSAIERPSPEALDEARKAIRNDTPKATGGSQPAGRSAGAASGIERTASKNRPKRTVQHDLRINEGNIAGGNTDLSI